MTPPRRAPLPRPPTDDAGGGGLADTGTQIALWSVLAAVLLATGTTLTRWMRRRRPAQR
ncbi:LPXTG cell wall anchor domain-containing protein [Streptomyces sp. NPDC014864]|uniref:LPXTG cell wall anchor domain-containing protein n=1 Tax=Streptomyces sp. NPDC014864 TaxID=3364924 RepID=UPI0036F5D108